MTADDLADFTQESLRFDGKTKNTYRQGNGPAIVVMSEMPGITRPSRISLAGSWQRGSWSRCQTCSVPLAEKHPTAASSRRS